MFFLRIPWDHTVNRRHVLSVPVAPSFFSIERYAGFVEPYDRFLWHIETYLELSRQNRPSGISR